MRRLSCLHLNTQSSHTGVVKSCLSDYLLCNLRPRSVPEMFLEKMSTVHEGQCPWNKIILSMLGDHQKDSGLCVMCHVSSYQATAGADKSSVKAPMHWLLTLDWLLVRENSSLLVSSHHFSVIQECSEDIWSPQTALFPWDWGRGAQEPLQADSYPLLCPLQNVETLLLLAQKSLRQKDSPCTGVTPKPFIYR